MKKNTKSAKTTPVPLSLLNTKCAGIDVGASELFVCIAKNSSEQEVRSFSTFTADPEGEDRLAQKERRKKRGNGIDRGLLDRPLRDAGRGGI